MRARARLLFIKGSPPFRIGNVVLAYLDLILLAVCCAGNFLIPSDVASSLQPLRVPSISVPITPLFLSSLPL